MKTTTLSPYYLRKIDAYWRGASYPSVDQTHRLTYRRTSHDNIHAQAYKEERTIPTALDMKTAAQ